MCTCSSFPSIRYVGTSVSASRRKCTVMLRTTGLGVAGCGINASVRIGNYATRFRFFTPRAPILQGCGSVAECPKCGAPELGSRRPRHRFESAGGAPEAGAGAARACRGRAFRPLMKALIVVNREEEWPHRIPGAAVVTSKAYLTREAANSDA